MKRVTVVLILLGLGLMNGAWAGIVPAARAGAGPGAATGASRKAGAAGSVPATTKAGAAGSIPATTKAGAAGSVPATTGARGAPLHLEGEGYTSLPRWRGDLTESSALAVALSRSLKAAMVREDAIMAKAETLAAASSLRLQMAATGMAVTQDFAMIYNTAPGVMPVFLTRLPDRRDVDFNVMAMLPLFTGGRLEALLRGARASEKAALAREAWELVDVAHDARTAYDRVLLARDRVDIAAWEVRQQAEDLRLAEQSWQEGRVAKYVVLRARAEWAEARERENDARADLEVASAALKSVLGADMASVFTFSATLTAPSPPGKEADAMALALKERPDLQAARQGVAAAAQAVEAARARWRPVLYGAGMGEGRWVHPGAHDADVVGGYSIGVVLSVPLVDGGLRRAGIHEAEAGKRRNDLGTQALELEVTQQVTDALARLQAARSNVDLARDQVAQATEDLRVARLRFKLGRAIQLEVLDALASLARARYAYATALYQANVAEADLLWSTGQVNLKK